MSAPTFANALDRDGSKNASPQITHIRYRDAKHVEANTGRAVTQDYRVLIDLTSER